MPAASLAGSEPWNAPHDRSDRAREVLYSTFQTPPRHLDPVSSYSENEAVFTGQIYEPPLQYHYLKRPYELEPLTLEAMPEVEYRNALGQRLAEPVAEGEVASVVYRLHLRQGIHYAPHPALARDDAGGYRYHALAPDEIAQADSLADFPHTGTRELIAADYVHQIKRLANPDLHSPILGFMERYIVGLAELAQTLRETRSRSQAALDLRELALPGARVVDRYTFEIVLKERYPQFLYWLAMPFFAPVPWEADRFYDQPGMAERNLTLDWYPLGTGPYRLAENNPNRRMVLVRNAEFRGEPWPSLEGEDASQESPSADGAPTLPRIEEIHFMLEKEEIPEWNKFLQGYYDTSSIAPDGFEQAIRFNAQGEPEITPEMAAKGTRLSVATRMSISYLGFNMLDPVVGGQSERARLLRQALAIAVDVEELISIFGNGRGVPAQGPLPPGIFGHQTGKSGINPMVYLWRQGRAVRRPLEEARALLADAGYPGGIDPATNRSLVLHLDATSSGPDTKSLFGWYRKQFSRLGLDLVVRSTDYNRFQEKMQQGDAQIFTWGWNADYPDPENFLFLLYGPNGKARHQGENAANYASPAFDVLFQRMRDLPNSPERQQVIDEMVTLVRHDSPWLWGFHPQAYALEHAWMDAAEPNLMARNTLKYRQIDPVLRVKMQARWNEPARGVVWLLAGCVLGLATLVVWRLRQRTRTMLS
jgi:ABC-type transport system substrate-binding protein